VAVADDPAFALDSGTVQFWFNARDTHGKQALFAKAGEDAGQSLEIRLKGDRIEGRLGGDDGTHVIETARIVGEDNWNHLAFTFGAGGMKLYLNGVLVGEDGFAGGIRDNREAIVIGGSNADNESWDLADMDIDHAFNGHIDEVAVFAGALDAGQIAQLIGNGPLGVAPAAGAAALSATTGDDDDGNPPPVDPGWLANDDQPVVMLFE